MNKTSPIRNKKDVDHFTDYYTPVKPNPRNHLLLTFGLNTALRIKNIMSLQWEQVYDFERDRIRQHLILRESKTRKENRIFINDAISTALSTYKDIVGTVSPSDPIFISQKHSIMSRQQAWRIFSEAAKYYGIEGTIGCHSMRKTFAYHAWKQGASPALIMLVLNHDSFEVTKRYLGIEQDEKDELYRDIYH